LPSPSTESNYTLLRDSDSAAAKGSRKFGVVALCEIPKGTRLKRRNAASKANIGEARRG